MRPLWRKSYDGFGSVGLSDERPLSGVRIQWQLSGDESEERTVNTRPIFVGRPSPKRPFRQIWILESAGYIAAVGDLNQPAKSAQNKLDDLC